MTTVSTTPATIQNSQFGKYAPSTPMDGELAHPDTRTAAIAAIPIARFGHLPLASGICRFKVVPAVGINVTPCSHANAFCLKFRGFGQRVGNLFGGAVPVPVSVDAPFSSSSPRSAGREIVDILIDHNNAERGIPHYSDIQCPRKKQRYKIER